MAVNGRGRPTKEQQAEKLKVNYWRNQIKTYEREFEKWEKRCEKICKRYRDDGRTEERTDESAKFNILWSNVQTLSAATFAKLPKPDVARRFRDNDPVGRVAGLILERGLEFEIQHYPDYRATLDGNVLDRFLGARGTAWVRYEPHFRAAEQGLPTDGDQITEDVDEPDEELDYECAPVDYIDPEDFGHTVARRWESVSAVWRKVYLTRDAAVDRFGEKDGKAIPLDAKPMGKGKDLGGDEQDSRALVYEIWDKEEKVAIWLSLSLNKILDEKPDPLGLEEFFPCPKPLYGTVTNKTLIPVPDFVFYQDQANELDIITDRIDGLVKALKVRGVYDATETALGRLFTEGNNNDLIPVKNWAAFAEKQGLKGSLDLVDIEPFARALKEAYLAFAQVKAQIDELTSIADIIRGQTDPNETLGAQELKANYASLGLKKKQESIALYATALLQLKAQIMCGKFAPATLQKIAAVEQLSPADQQRIPQAMQLLLGDRATNPEAESTNPMRAFRIEVEADSLVMLDENAEKQSRVEFLGAVGKFMADASKAAEGAPQLVPLLMELLKFGVTGFRVGKTVEGTIDQAMEQLKAQAAAPKPPVQDPEMMKVQAQQQSDAARLQHEQAAEQAKSQREVAALQSKDQLEQQHMAHEAQLKRQEQDHAAQLKHAELQVTDAFNRWKAELEAATKIQVAEISAKAGLDQAGMQADTAAGKLLAEDLITKAGDPIGKAIGMDKVTKYQADMQAAHDELKAKHDELTKQVSKPRRLTGKIKAPSGNEYHVDIGEPQGTLQ